MQLIRYATIGEKRYPINTDFKVAIECDKIIGDPDIDDFERSVAVVTLLFGIVPYEHIFEAQKKAEIYLGGGEVSEGKKIIDFEQHWDLIYSAFKGQYGIDLYDERMHYQKFIALLKGVKNTALSDVIELLSKNPNEERDYKSRMKLIEAQNKLKIKEIEAQPNSAFLDLLSNEVKGGKT